jgi:hypothetical protein
MYAINHVTYTAANGQAERDVQGARARRGEDSEAWQDQKGQVVDTEGTCAANRSFAKGQREGYRVLGMG